jgi:tetratricopeptide (TPR) repeat protein
VDIMPTVLTMLGVGDQPQVDGVDLTEVVPQSRAMFVESNLSELGLASLRALREGAMKYIHGPSPELYDLSEDPLEERDLIAARPEVAERMRRQLAEFFGDEIERLAPAPPSKTLSPSELAALEALGYVGLSAGAATTTRPAEPLPDPKQAIELIGQLDLAWGGSRDALISRLEEATRAHPRFALVHFQLARAYVAAGNTAGAEATLRRGLESSSDNPLLLYELGRLKLSLNDPAAALGCFRRLLAVCPDHVQCRLTAGALLSQLSRFDEAADMLVPAFRLLPADEQIRSQMIAALTRARKGDEAARLLREAIRNNPKLDAVRESLFRLLGQQCRYAESAQVLRQAVRERPDNLGFLNNLAALLSACPDESVRSPAEAVRLATRLCERSGYEDPRYVFTLSVAHMAADQAAEAVAAAEKAIELATARGQDRLAATIRNRLGTFKAGAGGANSATPTP